MSHTLLVSALGGSSLREGVGDLQKEESSGDKADGVGLKTDKYMNLRRGLEDMKVVKNHSE